MCRNFSHSCAVFESNNSSERNEVVEIENFICLIERAAEAMENAAQFAGVWLHDFKRVLPGVALMDYDIEPQLHREIELLLEISSPVSICKRRREFALRFLLRSQFAARDITCTCSSFATSSLGKLVIIEARLADRHHARVLRQFAQRRDHIFLCFFNVSRDERRSPRKQLGYFSARSIARRLLSIEVPIVMMRVTPASVARRSTSSKIVGEIRIIEMRVSFD